MQVLSGDNTTAAEIKSDSGNGLLVEAYRGAAVQFRGVVAGYFNGTEGGVQIVVDEKDGKKQTALTVLGNATVFGELQGLEMNILGFKKFKIDQPLILRTSISATLRLKALKRRTCTMGLS